MCQARHRCILPPAAAAPADKCKQSLGYDEGRAHLLSLHCCVPLWHCQAHRDPTCRIPGCAGDWASSRVEALRWRMLMHHDLGNDEWDLHGSFTGVVRRGVTNDKFADD